jgi:tripartite-type tricarboxylate transporter receptor subunit TctC
MIRSGIPRRRVLIGAAAVLACRRPARAGNHVTLIVGAVPATPPDALARSFAGLLGRALGNTEVAIRNLPGNGGLTALEALADAPPTGGTLGWVASPTIPARMVDREAGTLLTRLALLGAVEREPIAFVSPAAAPLDSVQEVIRRAAEDADAVPLGTPPAGSPPHLAALRLQLLTQTRLNIVTFPSAAAALQAVVSGNVAAAALGLTDAIGPLRDDKLSGIGIAAHNRAGLLPDLPVLNEGGVPLSASIRRGLALPAAVPAEVTARFAAALQAVAADPDFRDQADQAGFLPVWLDGAGWTAQIAAERADLTRLWASEPWLNSNGG